VCEDRFTRTTGTFDAHALEKIRRYVEIASFMIASEVLVIYFVICRKSENARNVLILG